MKDLDKNKAYCPECKTEMMIDNTNQIYVYSCHCYDNKYKIILKFCNDCNRFTNRKGISFNSKCCSCAISLGLKNQKEKDPEGFKQRMANNAIKANKIRKETFTKEDWKNWTDRSCNSLNANKNPKSKSENTGIKYCEICKEKTFHLNNCCTKCHPSSGTGRSISSEKAKEMRSLVKNPFDLNLLRDFSFKEIQCNKLCDYYNYCNEKNILLKNKWGWCEKSLKNKNFITENNVEYIFNHSTGKYEEKGQFYKNYKEKIQQTNSNEEIQKFINLGFTKEPIIKINDEMWNRLQTDAYLIEKGYGWIVYIKLFKNYPFIVGKTGTSKVSNSSIDFDFKVYNQNDLKDPNYGGQGRRFIREYYPEIKYTDFDYVLIKGFETEQKALECEQKIVKLFGLFES